MNKKWVEGYYSVPAKPEAYKVIYLPFDGSMKWVVHYAVFPKLSDALGAGHELTRDYVAQGFKVVQVG